MFARLSGMSAGARGLAGKARSTGGRATMGVHHGLVGGGAFMSRDVINRSLFFYQKSYWGNWNWFNNSF